jgi:predicted nucleic acid-binding protein
MRVFFDTSVLVAAFIESHPLHTAALNRFNAVRKKRDTFLIGGHTLAELYAVLTRLPVSPRITPELASQLIEENTRNATITVLSAGEYRRLPLRLERQNLAGGIVYDALLFETAVKAKADILITLNPKDFSRLSDGRKLPRIEQP